MDIKIIGWAFLIIILSIAAIIFWQAQTSQIEFKTVISGSMSPAINMGDVVVIGKANVSELKIGDVITFGEGKTFTTHRVINITPEGFVTKGDANKAPDMGIAKRQDVLGKVIFTIPGLGYLGTFVRTPIGFAIFILIPGALIIISEMRKIHEEVKGGKHKIPRLEYKPHVKNQDHINLEVRPLPREVQRTAKDSQYKTLREEIEKTREHKKDPIEKSE